MSWITDVLQSKFRKTGIDAITLTCHEARGLLKIIGSFYGRCDPIERKGAWRQVVWATREYRGLCVVRHLRISNSKLRSELELGACAARKLTQWFENLSEGARDWTIHALRPQNVGHKIPEASEAAWDSAFSDFRSLRRHLPSLSKGLQQLAVPNSPTRNDREELENLVERLGQIWCRFLPNQPFKMIKKSRALEFVTQVCAIADPKINEKLQSGAGRKTRSVSLRTIERAMQKVTKPT